MRKRACGLLCLAVAAVLVLAGCGVADYTYEEYEGVRYEYVEGAGRDEKRQMLEDYGLYKVPPEDAVGEELEARSLGEYGTQYFYRVAGLDSLDILVIRLPNGAYHYLIKGELCQNYA